MTKRFSEQVTINGHEFSIHYFQEYDFPANFQPNSQDSWNGLIEVTFEPSGLTIQESESIMNSAQNELYHKAVELANMYPRVYGNYSVVNNYYHKVTTSVTDRLRNRVQPIKVRVVFELEENNIQSYSVNK